MKNSPDKKQKGSRSAIKYGDVFRIGDRHVLACGDARDAGLVTKVLGKDKVKLVLCDVPYGVAYTEKSGFSQIKVPKAILNDEIVSESQYAQFTKDWIVPLLPHLAAKNAALIFNSDKMIFALRAGMESAGMKFSQILIWLKDHSIVGRKDYLPQHELIAYGWVGAHEVRKKDHSLLFYPKPSSSALHPTQKPTGLLRRLILNSTKPGDLVYDCFAGSGSTGIAAEEVRRRSVLIERDEEYCRVILDRFERNFGLKARRV